MLTREIEGAMVKCGPYWKDEVFGPLRLKLIKTEGNVDEGKNDDLRRKPAGDPGAGGFFFPVASDPKEGKSKKKDPADTIIKRTFLLSHTGYPDIPARKVVQFQYLEWPDMNVPDDPRGVLNLIRQVDQAVAEASHLNERGEDDEDDKASEEIAQNFDLGVQAIV
jgi:protein tyrosine phosphatase